MPVKKKCRNCGIEFYGKEQNMKVCPYCEKENWEVTDYEGNIIDINKGSRTVAIEDIQKAEIEHFLLNITEKQSINLYNYLETLKAIELLKKGDAVTLNLKSIDFETSDHIVSVLADKDGLNVLSSIAVYYLENIIKSVGEIK